MSRIDLSIMQRTPLHIAVKEFRLKTAEFLVDNGADIDSQDKNGVRMCDYLVMVYIFTVYFEFSIYRHPQKGLAFTIFLHKIINTKMDF